MWSAKFLPLLKLLIPFDQQAVIDFIIWLAPWAGKMNQTLRCDWLRERARWSYTACLGLLAWYFKIKDHFLVFYPI